MLSIYKIKVKFFPIYVIPEKMTRFDCISLSWLKEFGIKDALVQGW